MRHKLLLLAVLSLLAASCTSDSSSPATTSGSSAPTTVDTTDPPESSTTAPTTTPTTNVTSTTVDYVDFNGPSALGLWWTVVGVGFDDTLNVRSEPNASSKIVDELEPWSTEFVVTDLVEETSEGVWRRVVTAFGVQGWVNARFLVGQPKDLSAAERDSLIAQTENLVAWSLGSNVDREFELSDRALWVGGLGIWADGPIPWTWISASDLETVADWEDIRTFDPGWDDFDCGSECDRSLVEFLQFGRVKTEAETLVDDIPAGINNGFLEGLMWQAPRTLHRTVIASPADSDLELDWQRIHLVFDWSQGDPQIAMINTHAWSP